MSDTQNGVDNLSVGVEELSVMRSADLKRLAERLNRLESLMVGYRDLLVDFIKQLEMRELEDEYIQKMTAFFNNLEELLKYSRELTEHLGSVWELEAMRLEYEARVIKVLTGLLDTLEPEADLKAQEIEKRKQELMALTRGLAQSMRALREKDQSVKPTITG
ncbi:MAG: hypothetical protein QW688_09840 [Thermoprotei archaeon]